ncbi:MAG: hypothetical protein NHB15_04315 [Methanosarcina barkeri]|nr:hypothetical protein [Methanosarcina sp. ERenArc_MAG2]
MYSEIADFAIKLGYKPKQVFPRYEIKEISYLGVIMLAAIIRLNEVLG